MQYKSITYCVKMQRYCCVTVNQQPASSKTNNKKHLKNVGPIRHCEPPHADVHNNNNNNDDDDDNDNA